MTRRTCRPFALAQGALAFASAWVVGLAIARLTGAAAVVLVLAGAVAGLICAAIEARRHARGFSCSSVVGPTLITAGEPVHLAVTVTSRRRGRGPWRVVVSTTSSRPGGTPRSTAQRSFEVLGELEGPTSGDRHIALHLGVPVVFASAGVVEHVVVAIETAGSSGLIWWQRRAPVAIDPIFVAPPAIGPLLHVDESHSGEPGETSVRRGSPSGEVDGVRTWRDGEAATGIHWPSTLRSGELIVHDHNVASDVRWAVDVGDEATAGRLRYTLDAGLRAGHQVRLVIGDTDPLPIRTPDEAARWSAIVAGSGTQSVDISSRRTSWWKRRIDLRSRFRPSAERSLEFTPTARWVTAAAAAAALTMLVDALGGGGAKVALLAIGLVVGALVSNRFADHLGRRPLVLRLLIGASALGALVLIASESSGINGMLAALRGPLPDLLIALVVLHGFEVSNKRTLRVHQAITFIVAVYAAGLRIDDRLGWWLAAWAVLFVASITATVSTSASTSTGAARGKLRSLRPALGWGAIGVALTLGILVTVPVPDGPASLGLPALSTGAPAASPGSLVGPDGSPAESTPTDGTRGALGQVGGYPGFSETLDTSVRGGLSNDIVMRVRSPEPAFWRGQTFTNFDGRTWTVSPELGRAHTGPTIELLPTIGDVVDSAIRSDELIQTYFIEADLPNVVFAAQRAKTIIFDGTIWARPDGALRSDVTLTDGSVYTVVSERLRVTSDILRSQGDVAELFASFDDPGAREVLNPFLELPASTTDRTIELAGQLRTPGQSTYDTVIAYEAWLAANTSYDLNAPIPDEGTDAVDDFLFETQLGFCEQIASTLTIMLRSQGVPARLATGYLPGERDRVSGVWKVRARDAHAWVEVWFPDTGWQPFDPTAEVPLAGNANVGTVGGDLISAAMSSVVSHPIEIGAVMLFVLAAGALLRGMAAARRRRLRGRWGLMQDRFSAIGLAPLDELAMTNPRRAELIAAHSEFGHDAAGLEAGLAAARVSTALDRAAFDPTWADTDDEYQRTDSDLTVVERATKRSDVGRSTERATVG